MQMIRGYGGASRQQPHLPVKVHWEPAGPWDQLGQVSPDHTPCLPLTPHTPDPPTPSDLTISCTLGRPPLGAAVRARKGPAPNPTKLLLTCVLCVLQTFHSAVAGKPTNPC